MLHCKKTIQETHYGILSVNEDATCQEIRTSYRLALLNHHPDKLQNTHQTSNSLNGSNGFLKIHKAWGILGNTKSRAAYDSELRALRNDLAVADDVGLEDMMIEDNGEIVELFYQCRCGDYFSIDSSELGKMGYRLLRDGDKISFETTDALPASVILPCGSCSLLVRLLINANIQVEIDGNL